MYRAKAGCIARGKVMLTNPKPTVKPVTGAVATIGGGEPFNGSMLKQLAVAVLIISALPAVLNLVGFDFSSTPRALDLVADVSQNPGQLVDQLHQRLVGSFTHTILEWSAFCTAIFTVVLAFIVFRIKGEVTTPIIAVALFCAGCMDAFHTLAADRLIEATADNTDLIPFTWAISRAFNALIVMAGVGVIFFRIRRPSSTQSSGFRLVAISSLFFGLVAYGVIHYCAVSQQLPRTMFPDAVITRPWDAIALVLFICHAGLLWMLYRRVGGAFAAALWISVIADVATQLHMTFGSTALFDNHFNIAHFLKIITYLVPLIGITIDFVATYRQEQVAVQRLSTEIAERQQVEVNLLASEARKTAILESALDCVVGIDHKGKIIEFNPAAEQAFGYQRHEVIGQDMAKLIIPPSAQDGHDKGFARYLATGESKIIGKRQEINAQHRDGSTFSAELAVIVIKNEGGPPQFTAFIRDITQRKLTEKELCQYAHDAMKSSMRLNEKSKELEVLAENLRRRNTELDEFTYVTSHDLQEPLRKLISFSTLLRKDAGDSLPQQAEVDLKFITDAADRMQNLVRDLLTLSRTGRGDLKMQPVSLQGCMEKATEALDDRITETGATITSDELPQVLGDPTLLTQLYQNLIGNALKYCQVTPTVHLTVEHSGDGLVFGVRDNGIGIKEQYQEQIFAPFKRLHGRGEYEGTGIGLATCRKVVERHDGEIWVESQPDQGSHFKFTLNAKRKVAA